MSGMIVGAAGCCCNEFCPATGDFPDEIDVTLSGVDAAALVYCRACNKCNAPEVSAPYSSGWIEISTHQVDGVYTLTRIGSTTSPTISYRYTDNSADNVIARVWGDGNTLINCDEGTYPPDREYVFYQLRITVTLICNKVTEGWSYSCDVISLSGRTEPASGVVPTQFKKHFSGIDATLTDVRPENVVLSNTLTSRCEGQTGLSVPPDSCNEAASSDGGTATIEVIWP